MRAFGFDTHRPHNTHREEPAPGLYRLYESKNYSYGYDPHYEKLQKIIPNTHKNSTNKYVSAKYLSPSKLAESKQ